jgi:dipeptidase
MQPVFVNCVFGAFLTNFLMKWINTGIMQPEIFPKTRMPLFIKPSQKISPQDLMSLKRNHLQDTELDMSKDAGAGPFGLPYRWRGLTWKYRRQGIF